MVPRLILARAQRAAACHGSRPISQGQTGEKCGIPFRAPGPGQITMQPMHVFSAGSAGVMHMGVRVFRGNNLPFDKKLNPCQPLPRQRR
jgi:hypothetical protein